MKLIIIACLLCFILVINAATVPLTEQEVVHLRRKRSPLILTAIGAGVVGAGVIGAGILGAGLLKLLGAGFVGAKAGFAAGALAGSAARSYGGTYYYGYSPALNSQYRAELRLRTQRTLDQSN